MENSKNVKAVVVYHAERFQDMKSRQLPMAVVNYAIEKSTRDDKKVGVMFALEYAYRWTQNTMGSWSLKDEVVFEDGTRNADLNDSVNVIKAHEWGENGRLLGHRSTSVGDTAMVHFEDDSIAWYFCAPVGWKFINEGALLNSKLLLDESQFELI